jgi:hypothetical protein
MNNNNYGYFKELIDDSDYEEMFSPITPIQKLMEILDRTEEEENEKNNFFDINFFSFFIFDKTFYNVSYIKFNLKKFIFINSKRKFKPLLEFINRHYNNKKFLYYPVTMFSQYKVQKIGNRNFVIIHYPFSKTTHLIKYYEVKKIENIQHSLFPVVVSVCDEYNYKYLKNKEKLQYMLLLKEI